MFKHTTKILSVFFVIGSILFFFGCQEQQSVVSPDAGKGLSKETSLTIPAGATVVSAKLVLYQFIGNDKQNNIHRVTAPWLEGTVTWNNFGSAYDPTIAGSFIPAPGNDDDSLQVDITNLVQGWADCSYDNNGLLIDQFTTDASFVRSLFYSKENTNPALGERAPYLVVVLSTGATIEVAAIADSYIWAKPENINDNYGNSPFLNTGYLDGYEKQALVKFDILCAPPQCYQDETAWAANGSAPGSIRYVTRGNWATYLTYGNVEKTVNIYAGQSNFAGTAQLSAVSNGMVTITITLSGGWELNPNSGESVKIQGYNNTPPARNPAPGQFTTYKGNNLTVTVPRFNFYGIHLDVRKPVTCP